VYFDRTSAAVSFTHIVTSPGNATEAITVGSSNSTNTWTNIDGSTFGLGESNGTVASFSAAGPRIDGMIKPEILAPGTALVTTLSGTATVQRSFIHQDGYHTISLGTSFSAPQIAGLIALMLQVHPSLTSKEIKETFRCSGSVDQALQSIAPSKYGYGKINGLNTLLMLLKMDYLPPEFLRTTTSISNSISTNIRWSWTATADLHGFEILRRTTSMNPFELIATYKETASLKAEGDTSFQFIDHDIAGAMYIIREVDALGRENNFGIISTQSATSVRTENTLPVQFTTLSQNYPNPFNPTTKCDFRIAKAGKAMLRIYDMLGREVTMLVDEMKEAGSYSATFDGSKLTSGTYFAQLTVEPSGSQKFSQTRKMILTK
jgi:hypothetical protein